MPLDRAADYPAAGAAKRAVPAMPPCQNRAMALRMVVLDHVVERGGAQLAMARLAAALRPEVETTFILPGRGPFEERVRAAGHAVDLVPVGDIRTIRIDNIRPVADLVRSGPVLGEAAHKMAAVVRQQEAQVLYSNSLKAHVYGAAVARLAGVPHVAHVRDILLPPYLPLRLRHSLRLLFGLLPPAAVIANSHATARAVPIRRPATVIPSGITRRPEHVPRPKASAPTLAVLGRLERWKGQDVAIRALARLRRRLPDARLIFGGSTEVGDVEYARELHTLARALRVADAAEFVGFVDDPYAFFASAHVALHTSVFPEPFGQVVVEAMAVGRPVVATAAGGPLEVLEYGRSGLLVPPDDPDAAADAAASLLDSNDLFTSMAAAGVRRAGAYTIEASAARTLRVLKEVA